RSAFADETNIFFFPIRTASIVARGSRPKTRPVKTSSTTPAARATTYGTLTRGEGSPVIWPSLSRICFNVRFSPPRMYRSPGFALSYAATCPRAHSVASTRFNPVSTYAGNFRLRKSNTILPVGVGLMSRSPTGVVGLTTTTSIPSLPAWMATSSAINLERLYGPIMFCNETGESSLAMCPLFVNPMVATLDVNHTFHAVFSGRQQNSPRSFHIGPMHLLGIAHPEPVVRRDVKYSLATRYALFERE